MIQKMPDDIVIDRCPGEDVTVGRLVEYFAVRIPGVERSALPQFGTYSEAEARGRALARERHVSLWYEESAGRGRLVESFRQS